MWNRLRFRLNIRGLYQFVISRSRRVESARPVRISSLTDWPDILALMLFSLTVSMIFFDDMGYRFSKTLSDAQLSFFAQITDMMALTKWDLLVPALFCFLVAAFSDPNRMRGSTRLLLTACGCYAVFFLLAILCSSVLTTALKVLMGRSRPDFYPVNGAMDFNFPFLLSDFDTTSWNIFHLPFSFPSGHATVTAVKAVVFGLIFPRWRWVIAVCAFWLAISRVAIGVHYVSDLVAGAWIGVMVSLLFAAYMARRNLGFRVSRDGRIVPLVNWSLVCRQAHRPQ